MIDLLFIDLHTLFFLNSDILYGNGWLSENTYDFLVSCFNIIFSQIPLVCNLEYYEIRSKSGRKTVMEDRSIWTSKSIVRL